MSLPFPLPLYAALVAALLLIAGFLSLRRPKLSVSYPYRACPTLFTPAERVFWHQLEAALEGGPYRVFGKVRLSDLVCVQQGLARGEAQGAFNRIASKHVDFVICDPQDSRVLCAVELDDKSHERPQRRARDVFLERALEAAGVPLLRFPVRRTYDAAALREALAALPQAAFPKPPRRRGRR